MPTNLLKTYNQLLELLYSSHYKNVESIRAVFTRDFVIESAILLSGMPIRPTPAEGVSDMDRLFTHLTTVVTDKETRKRTFETERSVRLHWIRHHILEIVENSLYFRVEDENRVYILNKTEKYVVVLEPLRKEAAFYLLTAYRLLPGNFKKLMRKFETRGEPL